LPQDNFRLHALIAGHGITLWRVSLHEDPQIHAQKTAVGTVRGRHRQQARNTTKSTTRINEQGSDKLRASESFSNDSSDAIQFVMLEPEDIKVEQLYAFPTRTAVNCVLAPKEGTSLFCGGQDHLISLYRLDTLKISGPSLMMIKRSNDPTLDIQQHKSTLWPLLLEGTLVEWLLQTERDQALEELLLHRPGVALLPLENGKSTFELAISLRRAKTLRTLLEAAVRFTLHGEGDNTVPVGGVAEPVVSKSSKSASDFMLRLPSPALQRVTDSLVLALQTANMTEVVHQWLDELPMITLDLFTHIDLPFTAHLQFLGDVSSSGLKAGDPRKCIWYTKTSKQSDETDSGFPSVAKLVMLPGLVNAKLLQRLASQQPHILYSEPIRNLLDAMRYNGIQQLFYTDCIYFVFSVVLCYTIFVAVVVEFFPGPQSVEGRAGSYSQFIQAGALMMSQQCHDPRLSQTWQFILPMLCGVVSCLGCLWFAFRELHELFDANEDDMTEDEPSASELLHKEDWQSRMFGRHHAHEGHWDETKLSKVQPSIHNMSFAKEMELISRQDTQRFEIMVSSGALLQEPRSPLTRRGTFAAGEAYLGANDEEILPNSPMQQESARQDSLPALENTSHGVLVKLKSTPVESDEQRRARVRAVWRRGTRTIIASLRMREAGIALEEPETLPSSSASKFRGAMSKIKTINRLKRAEVYNPELPDSNLGALNSTDSSLEAQSSTDTRGHLLADDERNAQRWRLQNEVAASPWKSACVALRRMAVSLHIDLAYFTVIWNWAAWATFLFVWGTMVTLIQAWDACSESACQHSEVGGDGGAAAGRNAPVHETGDVECDRDCLCFRAINNLRIMPAIGIPFVYFYTLYYLRGFDSFNFYTRILFEIILVSFESYLLIYHTHTHTHTQTHTQTHYRHTCSQDMRYFVIIMFWLLLSLVMGMFSLQCHRGDGGDFVGHDQYSSKDGPFFYLMHIMAVSSLDPNFGFVTMTEENACSGSRGGAGLRHVAFLLFWVFAFILALVALNALIAIMGQSYANLRESWVSINVLYSVVNDDPYGTIHLCARFHMSC